MSPQGQMREFLSVEMRYRWLERNPRKPSPKCFRCGSGGIFSLAPGSPGASCCTEHFTAPVALTHPGCSVPLQMNPNKASGLRFQPAQKNSAVPSCRRSLCELALPDPDCSRGRIGREGQRLLVQPCFSQETCGAAIRN